MWWFLILKIIFSSVQSLSRVWLFATPWTAARQASLSITNSGVYSNSCPLTQWCHPTISSSVVPFSCLPSFPASGSFQMSQFFASGGQNIGASASASVLPLNIQDWFPVGLTGLISLKFKGLSRVFYSTTVRKHQLETILFISTTYILQSHSKNWIRRILNHFSKGNRGSSYCEPLVTFLSINQYKNCFCIDIVLFYVCFCLKTPLNIIRRFSRVQLFATPCTATRQASLSFTISQSLLKLMSIESRMPSNHVIFCHPLFLLPSTFPKIRVFSNESALHIRWPEYWSISFNISHSSEHLGLISFRIDWFDLLEV